MHLAPLGREAFARFGLRRLYAAATAPESARSEILAACERGETAAQIETRSRVARAAAPDRERGGRHPKLAGASSGTENCAAIVVEAVRGDDDRFIGRARLWNGQRLCVAFIAPAENEREGRFELALANGEEE